MRCPFESRQIAPRQDVLPRTGAEPSERELAGQSEDLDTALRNLGA